MRWALLLAVQCGDAPDGQVGEPLWVVECGRATCTKQLLVAEDGLRTCFGWTLDEGWPKAAPTEVQEAACLDGQCVVDLFTGDVERDDRCGCTRSSTFGDGCGCCGPPTSDQTEEHDDWVDGGAPILAALLACEVPARLGDPLCGEEPDVCGVMNGSQCQVIYGR